MDRLPEWLANLAEEDLAFIKNFVLSSGSLKQMSQLYQVSYPTMRLRLDRLIEKIRLIELLGVIAVFVLVFLIARSLIRYANSLKKGGSPSKQAAEDKKITLHDL